MEINRVSKIIIGTYLLAEVLLLVTATAYFIVFSKITDWELFAYHFYGSLLLFSLSGIIALFPGRMLRPNSYLLLLLLLVPELVALLLSRESLYAGIFFIGRTKNYFVAAYPLSVIIAFIVACRLTKKDIAR